MKNLLICQWYFMVLASILLLLQLKESSIFIIRSDQIPWIVPIQSKNKKFYINTMTLLVSIWISIKLIYNSNKLYNKKFRAG